MDKKIIKIRSGKSIKLNDYGFFGIPYIHSLWTIYDEEEMWGLFCYNPDNGIKVDRNNLDSLKPIHDHGVFLEKDWHIDYKNDSLYYHSSLVRSEEDAKVLIIYDNMRCEQCPNWYDLDYYICFCGITGQSKGKDSFCNELEKNVFDHGDVYDR